MSFSPIQDWLGVFCGWLWQTSLEASALIALVWLLQLILGKWLRPTWRYALGLLVLLRLLLPAAPASPFSIFNLGTRFAMAPPQSLSENSALGSTGYQPVPSGNLPDGTGATSMSNPGAGLNATSTAVPLGKLPTGAGRLPAPPVFQSDSQTVSTVPPDARLFAAVQFVWVLGFGWMLAGVFVRHRKFSRWVRIQPVITDPSARAHFGECRSIMNVRRPVALIQAAGLSTPALFGFWKPCLLLPPNVLNTFDPAEQRMVFLHELAHIKRGDIALNWLMIGVRALHWFNPLVWLALRRLRSDRELLCDEMVLARLDAEERTQYGHTLIKLVNDFSQAGFCPSLVPAINRKQEIKRRIIMIAQFKPGSRLAVALSLLLVLLVGAFTFTRAEDQSVNQRNANSRSNWAEQDRRRTAEKNIAVLQKQAAEQEQRLKEAQKEMDRLRTELKISDMESGNGIVGMEPETVQSIERERFLSEGMRAYYSALVETLRKKSTSQLRDVLPTANPDIQLTELLSKLSQAQTEMKALESKYKPQHPAMQAAESSVKELNAQIDARVEGILQGLETLAAAYQARALELERHLVPAKEKDARQNERLRPYFEAKRNVENQQRIYETIKLRLLQEKVDASLPPHVPPDGAAPAAGSPSKIQDPNEQSAPTQSSPGLKGKDTSQVDQLTIGRTSSGNFISPPSSDGKGQGRASTSTNLDRLAEMRGGTNQWDEVARLLREVTASGGSEDVKRNVQQLALLELAGVSEKRGQHAYALQLLAEYVERYPTDPIIPEIYLRQGLLYRQTGDSPNAIGKFHGAMRGALNPSGASTAYLEMVALTARSEIADTEYLQGKFEEAAKHYEMLLREGNAKLNRVAVKAKLIRSLAKARDSAGVVRHATEFLKEYPDSTEREEVSGLLEAVGLGLDEKKDASNAVGAVDRTRDEERVEGHRNLDLSIPSSHRLDAANLRSLAKTYTNMSADAAARLLKEMDVGLVAEILRRMSDKERAAILENFATNTMIRVDGKTKQILDKLETPGLIRSFLGNPEYREHRSLEIEVTPEGLVINILDRPNQPIFRQGIGEFTDYGTWVLNTVAWEIARYPSAVLEVEGHTEKGFKSKNEGYDSWDVSADMAASTRRILLKTGVKESQIVKVAGYDSRKPLKGRPPEDRTNRRATLVIRDKEVKD